MKGLIVIVLIPVFVLSVIALLVILNQKRK